VTTGTDRVDVTSIGRHAVVRRLLREFPGVRFPGITQLASLARAAVGCRVGGTSVTPAGYPPSPGDHRSPDPANAVTSAGPEAGRRMRRQLLLMLLVTQTDHTS